MSPSARVALLLLAGLALGGGGRLLLSTGSDEAPPRGAPPAHEAPAALPGAAEGAAAPAPSASPSRATSRDSLAADLARMLAALPPPGSSDGLSLEGTVLDERDDPVPGVLVRITPGGVPPGHDDTSANIQARDLEKYIVDRTAEHRFRHGGQRETRSDESGRVRFDGLAAARYQVEVPVEGMRVECRVGDLVRNWVQPEEEMAIRVLRTVALPVAVRYPDGSSPAAAKVSVSGGRRSEVLDWRPDAPALTVAAGSYHLAATVDEWSSPSVFASARAGGGEAVVLELARTSGISLVIELPEGETLTQGLTVRHLALAPGEEPTVERLLRHSESDRSWNWGGQGQAMRISRQEFPGGQRRDPSEDRWVHRIEPLPPARYALGIGRNSDAIDLVTSATVAEGIAEVTVALPPVAVADAIEVRALDPEGEPVLVFSSSLELADERGGLDSIAHATIRREDGSQLLVPAAASWDRIRGGSGELWVEAHAEGYGSARALVVGGSAVVRFAPAATVIVEAPGFDGEAEGWGAELHLIDGEGQVALSDSLDGPVTTLGTVGAGEYILEFESAGDQPIDPLRVFLAPGENRIPIAIPPRYALEVEVPEGLEESHWSLSRIDGRIGRESWFGGRDADPEEGIVRFEGLFPGAYAVLAMTEMGMSVEVQRVAVEGDLRIRFQGAPLDAILVRMRDDARLEGTDLRDGDLIIGVNEREFANSQDLMAALMLLSESPGGTLLLERVGSGRVTVAVPTGGLERLFDGGGILPVPISRQR